MRKCAFIVLAIAITGSGFSGESSINGEFWRKLGNSSDSKAQKVGIVRGYFYKYDTASIFIKKAAKADQSPPLAEDGSAKIPPYDMDSFVKALDRFYSDSKNSKVELDEAVKIITEKVFIEGDEQEQRAIKNKQEEEKEKLHL